MRRYRGRGARAVGTVAGVALWGAAGMVRAQTNVAASGRALPEIVVTASRTARDVRSEPRTVHRFDGAASTVQAGARTLPDVLAGTPSVMVQKTGYGQGSPYLRGFTGFRTACLVDGVRLNNSVFRDGPNQYWNTVDPLSIEAYELVMGPASVLYGSDAVGGTLNALPVTPPDYDGAPTWSRRLLLRAASADESVLGRVQLGGRVNPNLGFVGGLSLKRFGDLRGGDEVGEQPHTGYDELDYDGQVDYYVDEELWLRLGHQSVDQDDAWRTHRTIYGLRWHGLAAGDDKVHAFDQRRTLTYLKVHSEKPLGFVDGAELTLSRHAQAEDLYRIKKDATGERQGFDVTTWGASLQMQSDSPLGLWVYGVDLAHDVVVSYARKYKADGSFSKSEIQGPVADAAAYDTAGVFVEDTLPLLDGALDLAPGLRYTYARADADRVKDPITGKATGLSGDWDAVVGSLRALHPLTDDRRHTVFAGAAQGFRAPNLSDLTRFDIARSTEIETPVRDLDPERFLSGELGVRSLGERLETEVSYYYTLIDDLIVRTPTGRKVEGLNEVTKRNAGEGYVQGVEAAETCRLTREWSIWGRAAWMAGKVDAYPSSSARKERDYLSRLMPPTGAAGVRWQLEDGRLWCETSANLAGKADRLSADDKRDTQRIPPGGTPGYAVWNARVGVRLLSSVDLALAVENLLDADYRIHGSGVNEPGRNVLLTAACDF